MTTNITTSTVTIKIGKVFFDDHCGRDLIEDEYDVKETKEHYTVTMTHRDFAELISDAYHYTNEPEYDFGFRMSARSVLTAMQKQLPYDEIIAIIAQYDRWTPKYLKPWGQTAVQQAPAQEATASAPAPVAEPAPKILSPAERQAIMERAFEYGKQGFNIEAEAKRIWKLLQPYHKGRKMPTLFVERMGVKVDPVTGELSLPTIRPHANITHQRVHVCANTEWIWLAHEFVHCAVGKHRKNGRWVHHDRTFYHCLRDLAQRRFKARISFFEVTHYGYDVDRLIDRQLSEQNAYRVWGAINDRQH